MPDERWESATAYWEFVPTIDHIVPVALGGEDNTDNYATTSYAS